MKVLVFGDYGGIKQTISHFPKKNICGVVCAINRPQYHSKIKGLCLEGGIPFCVQPYNKREGYESFLSWVSSISPDLIFVNSYSMIIRDDVLSMPRFGGVNIHAALLPKYRGCNPIQWAILNDEVVTGVTMHEINFGLDTGPIISQEMVPILFSDTWVDLQRKLFDATEFLLKKNISSILSGQWVSVPQDESSAFYCRRRLPDDGLFIWDWPLRDIYNLVRALVSPHPGAFYINSDNERVVFSSYMSPHDLILYKKKKCPDFLKNKDFELVPESDFGFRVISNVGADSGPVILRDISWIDRVATLDLGSIPHFLENAVFDGVSNYAEKEWKIRVVR